MHKEELGGLTQIADVNDALVQWGNGTGLMIYFLSMSIPKNGNPQKQGKLDVNPKLWYIYHF